jgi:hypothetical protein
MDNPDGPDDEIAFDPLPAPHIPIPRAVAVIAGRIPRKWPLRDGRRPTWRGWLLAAVAAVVVIGALQLAGVIWTSAPPQWVTALGTGVTVTGPGQVAPGHGSPGAALTGLVAALSSKDPAASCGYTFVRPAARCEVLIGQLPRNQLPYGVSFKIGYVAVSGTRALVGFTGERCSPGATPECMTNTNPAAIFSAGDTFAALWTQTVAPVFNSPSSYRLQPCVEAGGKWYVGSGPVRVLASTRPRLVPTSAG